MLRHVCVVIAVLFLLSCSPESESGNIYEAPSIEEPHSPLVLESVDERWQTFWDEIKEKTDIGVPVNESSLLDLIQDKDKQSLLKKDIHGTQDIKGRLVFIPEPAIDAFLMLHTRDATVESMRVLIVVQQNDTEKTTASLFSLLSHDLGHAIPELTRANAYSNEYYPTLIWQRDHAPFWRLFAASQKAPSAYTLFQMVYGPAEAHHSIVALDQVTDNVYESLFRKIGLDVKALLDSSVSNMDDTNPPVAEHAGNRHVRDDYAQMAYDFAALLRQIAHGLSIIELATIRPSVQEDVLGSNRPPEEAVQGKYVFYEAEQDTLIPQADHLVYYDINDGVISDATIILTGEPRLIKYFEEYVLQMLGKDWKLERLGIRRHEKDDTPFNYPVLLLRLKDAETVVSLGIEFRKLVKEEKEAIIIILRKGPLQQVTDYLSISEQADEILIEQTYRDNGLKYGNIQSLFP